VEKNKSRKGDNKVATIYTYERKCRRITRRGKRKKKGGKSHKGAVNDEGGS